VPDPSQIERRVHWAATALTASSDELAEIDPEASARFAQEAARVADLGEIRLRDDDRSPRTRATALGRGNRYVG
jgi:hypothetical protein